MLRLHILELISKEKDREKREQREKEIKRQRERENIERGERTGEKNTETKIKKKRHG